jgi:hypothetical protein
MENRALDRKIWLWMTWREKGSFKKVLGVFAELLTGWKLRRERTRAPAKFGKFSAVFGRFLGCLEWLGTNRNYFLETQGLAAILPMSKDHGLIYNKLRGFFIKFTRFNGIRITSKR